MSVPVIPAETIPCFECDGTLERVLRPQKTSLPDLGEITVPDVPMLVCPACGETLLGSEGNDYLDAYLSRISGAITPEELTRFFDQYQLTQKEAAAITGYGEKNISRWLTGRMRPSASVSNFFRLLIADPAAFEKLKNRQWSPGEAPRYPAVERQPDAEEKLVLSQIDYRTLASLGVVAPTTSPTTRRTELCRLLRIPDLTSFRDAAEQHHLAMAAFKDTRQKSNIISGAVWIELGCRAASRVEVEPYDQDKLKIAVKQLRELTQSKLVEIIPEVQKVLMNAGVALVFVPIMKESAYRGCTQLVTPNKAIIVHSLKYRTLAQFWLILFHEIAHLMLHINGVGEVFAEYEDQSDDEREKEADEWARDTLVFSDALITFQARHKKPEPWQIQEFARQLKVHPAIAAEVLNKKAGREVINYGRLSLQGLYPRMSEEEAQVLCQKSAPDFSA